MGLGDWLIASEEVKRANEATGNKVKVGDLKTQFIDPDVLVNNPRIARGDEPHVWVQQYPGKRPYIKQVTKERLYFNDDFKVAAGELYLTQKELDHADKVLAKHKIDQFILVEPNVKGRYIHTANKSWPHFDELLTHGYEWLQLGGKGTERKTRYIETNSFREACAIMTRAEMFIGTDGGLHHAAAALGIPAIVIWTGFTSPKHLGYDEHINIHDGGEPCGTINKVCPHCTEIAKNISVERVLDAVNTIRCRAQR